GRIIERPALQERLDECLRVKLSLITAPAGFGKTTLLNMWYEKHIRQRGRNKAIAWITLDGRDNDPSRFWSAVWSALRRGQEQGSIDISLPLYSTPQMPIESILATLLHSQPAGILV